MEELFRWTNDADDGGSAMERNGNKSSRLRFLEERDKLGELPLRTFIVDSRTWTSSQHVSVSFRYPYCEVEDVLRHMLVIARRLDRTREKRMRRLLTENGGFVVKRFIASADPVDIVYPDVEAQDDNSDFEEDGNNEHEDAGSNALAHASFYRHKVRGIAQAVPLRRDGKYPDWLDLLFSSEARTIYVTIATTLSEIRSLSVTSWSPTALANHLIGAVLNTWGKQGNLRIERVFSLLLELTVKVWVAQQRMITELRASLGVSEAEIDMDIDDDSEAADEEDDGDEDMTDIDDEEDTGVAEIVLLVALGT
jgi:hypothetical protein